MNRRPPDLQGPAGEAWLIDISKPTPRPHSTLAFYALHCPHAHPLWSWWSLAMIHLRDVPGIGPAKKHYPEAEYEILVMSCDPSPGDKPSENERVFNIDDPADYKYLKPQDICEQFHGPTDEGAIEIAGLFARGCVDGILPNQRAAPLARLGLPERVAAPPRRYGPPLRDGPRGDRVTSRPYRICVGDVVFRVAPNGQIDLSQAFNVEARDERNDVLLSSGAVVPSWAVARWIPSETGWAAK